VSAARLATIASLNCLAMAIILHNASAMAEKTSLEVIVRIENRPLAEQRNDSGSGGPMFGDTFSEMSYVAARARR
jgi:hypothetical protein